MSTLGWEGPRIDVPRGSYQFRRLGTRHLRALFSLLVKYGSKELAEVVTSGEQGEKAQEALKAQIGRSMYDIALTAADDVFAWAFTVLKPVGDAPELTIASIDDEELVPIWFITTFITKLVEEHEDFDRFFGEFGRLISREGPLRMRLKTLSGRSKAAPDGATTPSSTTPTLG